jgi:cellulose biosynthesis protein BcsQ
MNPWNSSSSPLPRSDAERALPGTVVRFSSLRQQFAAQSKLTPQADPGVYSRVIVVFSPGGSAGETGIVANLGRALAMHGEEVLLLDTSLQESLARCFDAEPAYAGEIQTVRDAESDGRIRLAQLPIACLQSGADSQGWVRDEISALGMDCDRIIVHLGTAAPWVTRQVFSMSPLILIPLMPGWKAVLSLAGIERLLDESSDPRSLPLQPKFLLNQYDPRIAFHRTVREELRNRLGVRLLTLSLKRTREAHEPLALRDMAPVLEQHAPVSGDFKALAAWIRSRSCRARGDCGYAAEEVS